ncbi:MAG: electron transport complex subunit RsxC [Candidatus Omnitrophica bacterium]|nr:electron transport complex subunit RsxC [Candidatus Omnitrophota bacterium]
MIRVEEHKEPQHERASERFLNPAKLYLSLAQATGKPSSACVEIGNLVEEAQVIATNDGLISSVLHSPKKGKILNIAPWFHPVLKRASAMIIECAHEEKKYDARKDVAHLRKEELLGIIQKNGIVGLGGAAFPTHVKLNPPKKIDTLIINGCECEPYLAADYRLMVEHLTEVFKGIEIICKILGPKNVCIALEDNKPEAIKAIHRILSTKKFELPLTECRVLKTAYPQGGEKQLVYSVLKRKVPSGKLPFEVGALVQNVATCFAVYEAVYFDKPLIERLVTFAGDALVSPKNIWVKIGTTLRELFDKDILKFKKEPAKIICGGPMMGLALDGLDYPVLKGTGGFLFLSDHVALRDEGPCIRCGACVRECPVSLMPCLINLASQKSLWDQTKRYGASDCIECGVCSYVCPTNRRLVQSIKRAKLEGMK